jgi:hypothetical protein
MKLERISALLQARPLPGRAHPQGPAPGELLLLTQGKTADADLLATLSNGMTLRLTGLGPWQHQLRPGDALRVRVIANEPVLELEVEPGQIAKGERGALAEDDGPSTMTRHAAMRLDQAVLRQMTWQAPNPAALARSWHDLALERWGPELSWRQSGVPSQTTMIGPPPFREPPGAPMPVLDPWLLPVYAWGGVQMILGLPYADRRDRKGRGRRRRGPLLRLELAPPAIGPVVLDAHWLHEGVDLTITIQQAHAAELVQRALPRIAQALTQAAIVLADMRVMRGDDVIAQFDVSKLREGSAQLPAPRSLLALFRTLSESAVVLLQVVP